MLSWGFAGHRAPTALAELAADSVKETDEDQESARSFSMAVWSQGAADPNSFKFKAYFEKAAAQTYRLLPHFDKPSLVHLSAGFANAYGKRHYDPPEVDWTNIGEVRPRHPARCKCASSSSALLSPRDPATTGHCHRRARPHRAGRQLLAERSGHADELCGVTRVQRTALR